MAVKLIEGIEITAFIKQWLAISKDTNSAASQLSLVLFSDSTDMCHILC